MLLLLCSLFAGAGAEWLMEENPLLANGSSSLLAVGGNSVLEQMARNKEDYRLEAKNVTIFIPELHFSSQNGFVELSSINITADFLEVKSENHLGPDDPAPTPTPAQPAAAPPNEPFDYPELVASLNTSLDPCDNFYAFVCDGWMREHPIDEDKTSSNQFQLINNKIEENIKAILDDRANFRTLAPYDQMMFTLYDACSDNASRLATGSKPLLANLRSLKQSREMRFISDWLIKVWPVGLFYSVSVNPDMRNTSSNILTIMPNNVYLMSEKLYIEQNLAPKYIAALKKYLREVLELLFGDDAQQTVFRRAHREEEIERRVNAFVDVEVQMAQIINDTDKHYDNAYSDDVYTTLQQLQETLAGTINWPRYLQAILPEEVVAKKYPNGLGGAEARVSEIELIKKFEHLARTLSGQKLSDYMDWKVILSEVNHLDDRYLDASFVIKGGTSPEGIQIAAKELDRVLQGSKERPARWKECKGVALGHFPALVERVYIQKHMDVRATRLQMEEVFARVKGTFGTMLDKNSWMDPTTKGEAVEKLQRLNVLVGYMDAIFNETRLRKHYEEYAVREGVPFAEMVQTLNKLGAKKGFLQLLEPVEVDFSSLAINGFYYPIKNSIVLTGGILQGVFFNSSRPIPMNYGSIGVVLAHEITHGFDNNGRLHDQFGNVRNWWLNETAIAFRREKHCLIDQYNAIPVSGADGLHVNGNLTQGENIADNGGMRAAFAAMKAAMAENPAAAERRVRGLEQYSPEQLFFINYAFSWCTNQRHEAAVFAAVFDSHSPPEARVNVVLGNLDQFAEHFRCPAGSTMRPEKRCSVW